MSEYQCYEFVALDRPLTSKQMADLRVISTRADITPTRFWNEYQWGDLKADPAKLMQRYFDAHLYFANWGTHRLMLRIPVARVDAKALTAYFVADTAGMKRVGDSLILDLRSEDEEPDYYDENEGSLTALAPIRSELMRGDMRPAYLAWLMAVQNEDVDDGDEEPPVPPGLAELTAAQEAMVDFLRIDGDLVSAAATASTTAPDDGDALRAWVRKFTPRAKDEWLVRAVDAPDLPLGAELLRAFRAQSKPTNRVARRTVADLLAAADQRRAERHRAEAKRADRAKHAAEAAKNKKLDALAKRLDTAWSELAALVETSNYDAALGLAADLRDLAARGGDHGGFAVRFEAMRKQQYLRRRGFFDRWKRASGAG